MVRAHIHFHGTVQGVGFRYTCLSYAEQLSLTGWVKNLPSGSVEIMAEGPRERVEELLSKLKARFGGFVRDQEVTWIETGSEFNKFSSI